MKTQFLMSLILSTTLVFSCNGDKSGEKKALDTIPKNDLTKPVSLFWEKACESNELLNSFDCCKFDCYQIELLNDPFKDFVIITLDLRDSLSDIIFYSRFKYSSLSKKSTQKSKSKMNSLILVNPVTKDTIPYLYASPLKFILKPKNKNINTFFSKTIWTLSPDDGKLNVLDPEIWKVKGRSGDREIEVKRHTFKDSIYYSNLQNILNICKVKDYKYKQR